MIQKYKPKLVRDKIPSIIRRSGKLCETHKSTIPEYQMLLHNKMIEELSEFMIDPSIEEAADMYEVFLSILRHWDIDLSEVIFAADAKRDARGGFREGIVLDVVHTA